MTREQFTAKFPHASADTIRKNFPHDEALHVKLLQAKELPAKKRLRQHQGDGLNKTERAFFEHLKATASDKDRIYPHSFTILLANGVRYTPDFVVVEEYSIGARLVWVWTAYEVKGFMRDDAAVKIKVAASLYPIRFRLATKRRAKEGGGWSIEEVLP